MAAALLVASVGVGAVLVSHEAAVRLVHPDRDASAATPLSRGLAFENVSFDTEDAIDLRGWWMPAKVHSPVVIFLHGYGASKAQSLTVVPFLHQAGYSVLAFDFRGHGASDGTHTTLGLDESRDVRAAVAYVNARPDASSDIALFGWSMGAAAAILAGPMPGVHGLIADSSFAALTDVVGRVIPAATGLPPILVPLILAFARAEVGHEPGEDRPESAAKKFDLPLLIIQGLDDRVANTSDAEALHEAAPRSSLWLVPGAAHTGASHADPAGYQKRVLAFLAASFSAGP